MSDDVRRAAENLREMVGASIDLENVSVECVRDMWIVAQDHPYLAQQREEDDEKPIDGLWLASLGPLKKGDYELQISVDGYCAWWLIDSNGIDRGMYLCHAHTRGQVRRLLEALGIEGE